MSIRTLIQLYGTLIVRRYCCQAATVSILSMSLPRPRYQCRRVPIAAGFGNMSVYWETSLVCSRIVTRACGTRDNTALTRDISLYTLYSIQVLGPMTCVTVVTTVTCVTVVTTVTVTCVTVVTTVTCVTVVTTVTCVTVVTTVTCVTVVTTVTCVTVVTTVTCVTVVTTVTCVTVVTTVTCSDYRDLCDSVTQVTVVTLSHKSQ